MHPQSRRTPRHHSEPKDSGFAGETVEDSGVAEETVESSGVAEETVSRSLGHEIDSVAREEHENGWKLSDMEAGECTASVAGKEHKREWNVLDMEVDECTALARSSDPFCDDASMWLDEGDCNQPRVRKVLASFDDRWGCCSAPGAEEWRSHHGVVIPVSHGHGDRPSQGQLDGIWVPAGLPNERIAIYGHTIRFSDGSFFHLTVRGSYVEAEIFNKRRRAKILPNQLTWEDGEMWVRDDRKFELQIDHLSWPGTLDNSRGDGDQSSFFACCATTRL